LSFATNGGKQEMTVSKTWGFSAPNSSGVPYDGSADEEYWGIVRRDRTKKLTFNVVKDLYSNLQNN
jgi:hypothetical protein